MAKEAPHNESINDALLHIYNLLDLFKLSYVNRDLVVSFASELASLMRLGSNILVLNWISFAVLGIAYALRCYQIVKQSNTTSNNRRVLDKIALSPNQVVIHDNSHVYRHLISSRVEQLMRILMFFTMNLTMFYVACHQISHLLHLLLRPFFSTISPFHQPSHLLSGIIALNLTYLKSVEFFCEQNNTNRFIQLVKSDKLIIKQGTSNYQITYISCAAVLIVSACVLYLLLHAQWVIYTGFALASLSCITWMMVNKQMISTYWLPHITGLTSCISAFSAFKQALSLHQKYIPFASSSIGQQCFDSSAGALSIIYGFYVHQHESQHKTVETLIEDINTTPNAKNK